MSATATEEKKGFNLAGFVGDKLNSYSDGQKLWHNIYQTDKDADLKDLTARIKPIGQLKDVLFPNTGEMPVGKERRAALKTLADNPSATAILTELASKDEVIKEQLATAFKNGDTQALNMITNAAVSGKDEAQKTLASLKTIGTSQTPEKAAEVTTEERRLRATTEALKDIQTFEMASTNPAIDKCLKFKNANGEYVSFKGNEESIKATGMNEVAFTMPGSKETRLYKRVNTQNEPIAASAWQQVDNSGKPVSGGEVVFSFPGFDGKAERNEAVEQVVFQGKLNPQVEYVPAFLDESLKKINPEDKVNLVVGSDSLGTSNAIAAKVYLESQNVKVTKVYLNEPVGAQLAADKLKESTLAKNANLSPEQVDKILNDGTVSPLRNKVKNEDGTERLSNAAMMQIGSSKENNAHITAKGRTGAVDRNNEVFGNPVLMDVTGRANISPTEKSKLDPTHARANTLDGLLDGAPLEYRQLTYSTTPGVSESDSNQNAQKAAKLEETLNQYPELKSIVESVMKNGTNGDGVNQKTIDLAQEILNNPDKIKPVGQFLENHKEFAGVIKNKLGTGTPDPKAIDKLQDILNNPERVQKFDQLLASYPELKSVVVSLSNQPQTEINQQTKDLLAKIEQNPDLLEPIGGLLKNHPELAAIVNNGASGGVTTDPYTIDLLNKIIDSPTTVAKLDQAIKENPDLVTLLSGDTTPTKDIAAFIQRNPTLLDWIQDPEMNALYKASKFANDQGNAKLASVLDNKLASSFYSLFASMGAPSEDTNKDGAVDERDQRTPVDPFICLLVNLAAVFFGFGSKDGINPQNLLNLGAPEQAIG